MKRHTTHVLHAVDPSQIENGFGEAARMPKLTIVIGGNGARVYDADSIARGLGDWNDRTGKKNHRRRPKLNASEEQGMKNRPYPEGWRPTWARLAIFLKPARGRYKLYAVSESSLEHGGEQRIAADGQPHHGFKTLADARRALAETDPAAELAKLRDYRGHTRTPPGETSGCCFSGTSRGWTRNGRSRGGRPIR